MCETFDCEFWWLIPLILILLCFFWGRGCCFGRRHHRDGGPEGRNDTSPDSALEILCRRYARGEIDDEEYEKKRRTITSENKGETK